MAKTSELTAVTVTDTGDVIYLVQGGNSRQGKMGLLKDMVIDHVSDTGPALQSTVWFRDGTGKAGVKNLLNQTAAADSSGTLDVDSLWPGDVPSNAQALILTMEVGYSTLPAGGDGAVSLRVMPAGYNLSSVLDRAKVQQVIIDNTAIDVVANHVLMPVDPSRRTFFWARQSTDTATANKMSIIDLWGYVR